MSAMYRRSSAAILMACASGLAYLTAGAVERCGWELCASMPVGWPSWSGLAIVTLMIVSVAGLAITSWVGADRA